MRHYASHILPNLYLGDLQDVNNHMVLEYLNIKEVISLIDKSMDIKQKEGIIYHTYEIEDSEDENINILFEECSRIISLCEKEGKNILVHCRAGISRSATIVIAHLMLTRDLTRKEAFEHVSQKRFFISPNDGFMEQLKQLEYSD